jgi:hypothetical protein
LAEDDDVAVWVALQKDELRILGRDRSGQLILSSTSWTTHPSHPGLPNCLAVTAKSYFRYEDSGSPDSSDLGLLLCFATPEERTAWHLLLLPEAGGHGSPEAAWHNAFGNGACSGQDPHVIVGAELSLGIQAAVSFEMVEGRYLCLRPPANPLEKRVLYFENALVNAATRLHYRQPTAESRPLEPAPSRFPAGICGPRRPDSEADSPAWLKHVMDVWGASKATLLSSAKAVALGAVACATGCLPTSMVNAVLPHVLAIAGEQIDQLAIPSMALSSMEEMEGLFTFDAGISFVDGAILYHLGLTSAAGEPLQDVIPGTKEETRKKFVPRLVKKSIRAAERTSSLVLGGDPRIIRKAIVGSANAGYYVAKQATKFTKGAFKRSSKRSQVEGVMDSVTEDLPAVSVDSTDEDGTEWYLWEDADTVPATRPSSSASFPTFRGE